MRILNVNSIVDPVSGGGTAERTIQVSKTLAEGGHDVAILSIDIGSTNIKRDLPAGLQLILLRCLNERFQVPCVSIAYLRGLVRRYQVIHMMGHWSILNALVAKAAWMESIPYVLCPAGALPVFGRSRLIKWIFNQVWGMGLVRRAKAWIAVTDDESLHFADYGVPPSCVTVIPNGISPKDYADESEAEVPFRQLVGVESYVLFVGRLNYIKGPDILLECFGEVAQKWPNLHLVFAGPDGGMLEGLMARVKELRLQSRVHFLGYVGGGAKVTAYRHAKFLVIPSRSEAMSIVVLEAGACSIPVVLTDQCGFNKVQTVGGGIEVTTNPSSITSAMMHLLEQPEEARKMGQRLNDFVIANYTWDAMVDKYISLYGEIGIVNGTLS